MIPKTFQLANRTWRVEFKRMSKKHLGWTSNDLAVIRLNSRLLKRGSEELLNLTFFHELLHAITGTAGEAELNADEERIDRLATLFAQVFQTAD